MKKILFIDHDPVRSGSTVSLEYLIRSFADRSYKVFVHTPKTEASSQGFVKAGAKVLPMGKRWFKTLAISSLFTNRDFPFSPRGLSTAAKDLVKLLYGVVIYAKVLRSTGADLVYVNEHVVIQASLAARLVGVPAVVHVRSMLLSGTVGIRLSLMRMLIRRFNRFIFAITHQEAAQLNLPPDEASKVKLVGEFFDIRDSGYKPLNGSEPMLAFRREKHVVLMLGGIQSMKGSLDFLCAAEEVLRKRNDVTFIVAGTIRENGSRKEREHYLACQDIVQRLKPIERLWVLGEIDQSLELVAMADIVVSPATISHFSRPVIEAWGFGKPVVATATKHMNELISDGINGILVNVGSSGEIAESIQQLLEHPDLRKSLGEAGKRKVAKEFDAARNAGMIVDCCDTLVGAT